MDTDHVWGYSCELSCVNCGQSPKLDAMSAVALVDVIRGFLLMHRRCEKPVEPSKQVELFDALAAKEARHVAPKCCGQRTRCINCPIPVDVFDKFPGALPAIDASTDDPAPEIDPPMHEIRCDTCDGPVNWRNKSDYGCPVCSPGWRESEPAEHDKLELTEGDLPDDYAKFAEMYPMASDPVKLTEQARRALGNTDYSAHLFDAVAKWHPSSVAFQETAHWARVYCAHIDSEERGLSNTIPGLTIPAVLPTPKSLQEALRAMNGGKASKKKRAPRKDKEPLNGSDDNRRAPNAE